MSQNRLFPRLARAALASTLVFGGAAIAAETRTENGPATVTRGTNKDQAGYWYTYTETTYRNLEDVVREAAAGSNLSAADLRTLTEYMANTKPTPSDSQLKARIQAINDDKAIAAWRASYTNSYVGSWSQAGQLAMILARSLSGGANSGDVYFDGGWWYGSAHNWATTAGRGWPLEAAMIHSPEWTRPGDRISSAALLKAWDIVKANIDAHGWNPGDPLVLDLNGNGKIDVTGLSSAKFRATSNQSFVESGAVKFDLRGTGKPILTEWVRAGEGILVDNRKNKALNQIASGKNLTVMNLFGDADGYTGGFMKLAREFDSETKVAVNTGDVVAKGFGVLKGDELKDMLVWMDNGDGKAEKKEMHTLASLGITEIRLPARFVEAGQGEYLEQASFVRNGKPAMIQEVWFGTEDSVVKK